MPHIYWVNGFIVLIVGLLSIIFLIVWLRRVWRAFSHGLSMVIGAFFEGAASLTLLLIADYLVHEQAMSSYFTLLLLLLIAAALNVYMRCIDYLARERIAASVTLRPML